MSHWTEATYIDSPEVIGESMARGVEQAGTDVASLLSLLGDHGVDPDSALDVACGIGRHAVELARAGLDVHGVDVSPDYVETARERAADAGVGGATTVEVLDVRDLETLEATADLVLHWFAFGYFADEVNEEIAAALHDSVSPSGALVLGLDNAFAEVDDGRSTLASESGEVLQVERREYDPATGRLSVQITKFRATESGSECLGEVPWDVRLYTPVEVRRLLERAGFSTVSLYGSLDGEELGPTSSPLVAVAEP